jgi:hypothetical protein
MRRIPTCIRRSAPRIIGGAAALSVAAALVACGAPSETEPAADSLDEPDDGRTEVEQPQPRLVVATETGVTVLDAADGTTLATFQTEIRPTPVVAGDGRHVFLVQTDADVTQVLDAGSWPGEHGDHAHYYVAEPVLRDLRIEGDAPVHVVSHHEHTAIFNDGDGTATVFRDAALLIDSLDPTVIDSGDPHHGVVVPLDTGAVVSIPPPPGDDTLPTGVFLVDESGAEIERFDDCPGLHGETTLHGVVVFACDDGVLLIEGDGAAEATKVEYPSDGGRIGSFTAGPAEGFVVGNYTETALLAVDVEGATAHEISVDAPYAARALDEHGELVLLTTDGTLHVIDPADGAAETAVPDVLPPFEIPEDWREPRPTITVVGHTAFVADPATSTVVPVDLDDGLAGDPFVVDGAPTAIVAVGTGSHAH